jgi:hypothetical protein
LINTKNSIFLVAVLFCFSFAQYSFGHGLGSVESDLLEINGDYLKIKIDTDPDVLDGNEKEISFTISTINDSTGSVIDDVLYHVDFINPQTNQSIISFDAKSVSEKLYTKIIPSENVDFSGDVVENHFIGTENSPLRISAPLFLQGGLVQVNVSLKSLDSVPVNGNSTFENLLTIGQYIPFEITDDVSHNLMFATYFDRIDKFEFETNSKKLSAYMPFNWDRKFIEKIPFVHSEFYIPKEMSIFNDHEILMYVNDIQVFGTIDRSVDDEIVVHFLIPSKKLEKLSDSVTQKDVMVFTIESGKLRETQKQDAKLEDGDTVIVKSTEDYWKFYLTLQSDDAVQTNSQIKMNLEFRDPVTSTVISQIDYDLDLFLNGKNILSESRYASSGRDSIPIVFEQSGAVILRISNVNDFDTSGEFSFQIKEKKSEKSKVPDWVKNNAKWWSDGQVDDSTFTQGIGFLIKEKIITVSLPPTASSVAQDNVPDWVKNNAKWWSDGMISEDEFLRGINYMLENQIIQVK